MCVSSAHMYFLDMRIYVCNFIQVYLWKSVIFVSDNPVVLAVHVATDNAHISDKYAYGRISVTKLSRLEFHVSKLQGPLYQQRLINIEDVWISYCIHSFM